MEELAYNKLVELFPFFPYFKEEKESFKLENEPPEPHEFLDKKEELVKTSYPEDIGHMIQSILFKEGREITIKEYSTTLCFRYKIENPTYHEEKRRKDVFVKKRNTNRDHKEYNTSVKFYNKSLLIRCKKTFNIYYKAAMLFVNTGDDSMINSLFTPYRLFPKI